MKGKLIIGENFIFVHTPKTGGTSIREMLHRCGKRIYIVRVYDKTIIEGRGDFHIRIRDVGIQAPNKFKFCFVRNPWDHRVSYYAFVKTKYPNKFLNISFDTFIKTFSFKTISFYIDDDYDKIFQYENINNNVSEIKNIIGIPDDVQLPWANKSNHDYYRKYYTDELINIVAEQENYLLSKFPYKF